LFLPRITSGVKCFRPAGGVAGKWYAMRKSVSHKHIHIVLSAGKIAKLPEPTNNPNFAKETNFDNVQ
jgi:hypothetical protein